MEVMAIMRGFFMFQLLNNGYLFVDCDHQRNDHVELFVGEPLPVFCKGPLHFVARHQVKEQLQNQDEHHRNGGDVYYEWLFHVSIIQ
jgi:hypothetical protein